MKQNTFALNEAHESYNSEDFILSLSNLEAYKHITENTSWPLNRLIILGAQGSGKTHLSKVWQSITDASYIKSYTDLTKAAEHNDKFVLDDMDELISENELFEIINHCQNNSYELLLTASELKDSYSLADLRSRINATKKVIIKQPDEETLKILLSKHLSNRQLNVPQEVIEYICNRAERSYEDIQKFAERLDLLSLEEKRNITIPFVKKTMEGDLEQ